MNSSNTIINSATRGNPTNINPSQLYKALNKYPKSKDTPQNQFYKKIRLSKKQTLDSAVLAHLKEMKE